MAGDREREQRQTEEKRKREREMKGEKDKRTTQREQRENLARPRRTHKTTTSGAQPQAIWPWEKKHGHRRIACIT